jgi:transposase InsO family protein
MIGESGKRYLAAILDLYSRFIGGWAVSAVNNCHLTIQALEMALKRRCPNAGLLHRSDQGCTDASEDIPDSALTRLRSHQRTPVCAAFTPCPNRAE